MNKLKMVLACTAFLLLATPAFASDSDLRLGSKGQLNGAACDKEGRVVINVEEKVKNDVDSGYGGNWAIDNYTRHIKVWQTDDNDPTTWCATLTYDGKFNAAEGATGPGGTGTIGPGVQGEMRGGYRATFNGTLKTLPLWPTHGSVGTVDYGCDITGATCNYLSWPGQYFDGVTNFVQTWWGWIYKADKKHGTWLNQIDVLQADSGNIL
jgi:hypothetical protein